MRIFILIVFSFKLHLYWIKPVCVSVHLSAWHPTAHMMTSSNGNIFRITGLFLGEFSWSLGIEFREILIKTQSLLKKINLKMSSAKWWPFCLCLSVLILGIYSMFLLFHNFLKFYCVVPFCESWSTVHHFAWDNISEPQWWNCCALYH